MAILHTIDGPVWIEKIGKKGLTLRIGPKTGRGQSQTRLLTSKEAEALAHDLLGAAKRVEIKADSN
jgi:hypothetical protein